MGGLDAAIEAALGLFANVLVLRHVEMSSFFIISLPITVSPPAILGGSARGDSGRVDQWRVW
jgi:hypothetical protein